MPVTVRDKQFYTKAEVVAMRPAAKIDDNWEKYSLTLAAGYGTNRTVNNSFLVNKHTGLVTGVVDIAFTSSITSSLYGTNANLAILADAHAIKYPGYNVYTTLATTATANQCAAASNLNTNINASGQFSFQGEIQGGSGGWENIANLKQLTTHIENFAYVGSKYGKVTTQDVRVEYMKEGEFYDLNSAELIAGKRWFKTTIPLPAGYDTSKSHVTVLKNLWSGEVILQLSLYPTTAGSYPAIALPERFRFIKNGNEYRKGYMHCRYHTGGFNVAVNGSTQNHNNYLYIGDTLSPYCPGSTWFTGSYYIQGNPENRLHQRSTETVVGQWMPDKPAQAVPSVDNDCWANGISFTAADVSNSWLTGYTNRATIPSWTTFNRRTGMVFVYLDMTTSGTTLPAPVQQVWAADYLPSYRYNQTAGAEGSLYILSTNYVQYSNNTTTAPSTQEYTSNLYACCAKTNGAAPTTAQGNQWRYGTPGYIRPIANNLSCWQGYFLGNTASNCL